MKRDLMDLFDYLEDALAEEPCDHSHRFTESFLASREIAQPAALGWLRHHGGECDCAVLDVVETSWLDEH